MKDAHLRVGIGELIKDLHNILSFGEISKDIESRYFFVTIVFFYLR